jgi:hypothetical protein
MHEPVDHPHVGGTGGAASQPPQGAPSDRDDESIGSGDIEVPLGVPVSPEEFRRLKRQASRTGPDDADDAPEQAQQDDGHEDRGRENRS